MAYKLTITEYADELLDNLMYHLLYQLKNEQAARHLLDGIESVYERLEDIIVFSMKADIVNVMGIFHQLENYQRKM